MSSIFAQRFISSGNGGRGIAVGTAMQVNTTTSGDEYETAVAINDSGQFVVTWEDDTSFNTESPYNHIRARFFDPGIGANGSFVGNDFVVDALNGSYLTMPSVSIAANGTFAVTWSGGPQIDANPSLRNSACLVTHLDNNQSASRGQTGYKDSDVLKNFPIV